MKSFFKSLLIILCVSYAPKLWAGNTITIGSKNFTEQAILGEVLAQLIEAKTDLNVERKFFLGGTSFTFEALKNGQIDVYPAYTGTGYVTILKRQPSSDPEHVLTTVRREFEKNYGLLWLEPFGFNNTYAMALRSNDKRFASLTKLSDLLELAPSLKFGAPHEFAERPDGYNKLQQSYGLQFGKFVGLDPGLMYQALMDGHVDIITAFSTDGRLQKFDLKVLKDDKQFFPPYFAAPLIRRDVINKHPELTGVLNQLAGTISDKKMMQMNFQADLQTKPIAHIAQDFLAQAGLITKHPNTPLQKQNQGFLSYLWLQKSHILWLIVEHMQLVCVALVLAMVLSIPLGIFLTRQPKLSGPIFAVINTIQTIPSLALLGFLIPLLGIGNTPAIVALFLYALLPLVRNTYTGIKDIDPKLIEVAKGMGLTNFQTLQKIEIPLALPTIMAGIRISAILMIGTATLAALIGAGGLGDPIFRGISSVNHQLILLGALPAALLAIVVDRVLHWIERHLSFK